MAEPTPDAIWNHYEGMFGDKLPVWGIRVVVAIDPASGHQVYQFRLEGDNLQVSNIVGTLEVVKQQIMSLPHDGHEHS